MRIIEVDGSGWSEPLDFYNALFEAIEQGYPHGVNLNAFIDSMVWRGMGGIEPPYVVSVVGLKSAPDVVKEEVQVMATALAEAREERLARDGIDIDVSISTPDFAH